MTDLAGTERGRVIGRVADHLVAHDPGHPLRVAVDGITAAGKSTLAGELVAAVRGRGRPAVQLSTDDYHHLRAHRYRQGRDSATGYYQDAYDLTAFAREVLDPLGPGGSGDERRYRARLHDTATDLILAEPLSSVPADAVVVVDGSFLQRPELAGRWDEVVWLDTGFEQAQHRGARRDLATGYFASPADAERGYRQRYHGAARLYLAEVDPAEHATVVIGNDDVDRPQLRRIGAPRAGAVRLFSYGTLQLPQAQRAHFGREFDGRPDRLVGHRADWVTITDPAVIRVSGTDRHPIVRPTGDPADAVPGTVFTLTSSDLAAADGYEVDDYRRVLARLGSGIDAWVYLATG